MTSSSTFGRHKGVHARVAISRQRFAVLESVSFSTIWHFPLWWAEVILTSPAHGYFRIIDYCRAQFAHTRQRARRFSKQALYTTVALGWKSLRFSLPRTLVGFLVLKHRYLYIKYVEMSWFAGLVGMTTPSRRANIKSFVEEIWKQQRWRRISQGLLQESSSQNTTAIGHSLSSMLMKKLNENFVNRAQTSPPD